MYRPLYFALGLRYIRAKRKNQFISFISLVSIIGIALGVAVLIIVLSVMNGFDNQIKTRMLSMVPQVTLTSYGRQITGWQKLANKIKKDPKVMAVAPFVETQAMLQNEGLVSFGIVQGIDPELQKGISPIAEKVTKGKLSDLASTRFGIVLGDELANTLGVGLGDKVSVIIPKFSLGPVGMVPKLKQFKVVGLFHSGYQYDSGYAYISLKDAQILNALGSNVTGLEIKLKDLYLAPSFANNLENSMPGFLAMDWTKQNEPFFKALKMEKIMMTLILVLIIAIAAFNMLSSLVMLVVDKRSDIAILMTLGMRRNTIMKIFIVQGTIIGIIGILIGLILGVVVAYNVTDIVDFIQRLFGVQFLSSDVYYIDYLPSKIELSDLVVICVIAFVLSYLATLYPAWRASRIKPAEALRYE
jgi:lipoprotein-releasing system permease protein